MKEKRQKIEENRQNDRQDDRYSEYDPDNQSSHYTVEYLTQSQQSQTEFDGSSYIHQSKLKKIKSEQKPHPITKNTQQQPISHNQSQSSNKQQPHQPSQNIQQPQNDLITEQQTQKTPFEKLLSSQELLCIGQNPARLICVNGKCLETNPFICKIKKCECNTKHSRCSEKRLKQFIQVFQDKRTVINEVKLCLKQQIKTITKTMKEHKNQIIQRLNHFDWGFQLQQQNTQYDNAKDNTQDENAKNNTKDNAKDNNDHDLSVVQVKLEIPDQNHLKKEPTSSKSQVIKSASDIRSHMLSRTLEISNRMQQQMANYRYEHKVKRLTEPLIKSVEEVFKKVSEELNFDKLTKKVKKN